ncbi:hypothetical protein [Haloarchaeobius sp. HRN-SO-5]|uniref:hypothetical protein n=1 Tax=Haloarchaeobius sp. HRN-SO-5 TaxID=3446118 RepID=UPI003EBFAB11
MSSATPNKLHTIPRRLGERLGPVATPVRMASFWLAIALPFAHLSLLASGIETPAETQAFLVLLVLNLGALVVGHGHRND